MFDTIKSQVNLLEYIEKDLGLAMKDAGTDTFSIEDEKDYGGCPFCNHMDCFRIKHVEGNNAESIFKCFSCGTTGSVIDWVVARENLTPVEAAKKLAKEFNVTLPNDFSPIQELFNCAAIYYSTCLWESCNTPNRKLSSMTPLEYQVRVRKHSEEALKHFNVGWSDGGLITYLEGLGYDDEMLLESGLKSKKSGKDFLPTDCFIYPHYVKGRVSHFTFKDPLKKLAYQLPNKFVLNGCEFYNQDSVKDSDTVIIVEGENDVISVWEKSRTEGSAVIGTIGSISGDQLDWIRENLANKVQVITAFDPDDAGNKYREKTERLRSYIKGLIHVMPPEGKDIDALLSSGKVLNEILNSNVIQVSTAKPVSMLINPANTIPLGSAEVESEDGLDELSNGILEKNGFYYKVKFKDGEPTYTQISDCTWTLQNVFKDEEGNKMRTIIVTKVARNGRKFVSDPQSVSDTAKVTLQEFRVILARAADASFRGTADDLMDVWSLIFHKGNETPVDTARVVGRYEKVGGWVFRNKFIMDGGTILDPDDAGIFWTTDAEGYPRGVKPASIDSTVDVEGNRNNILKLETDCSDEETEELLQGMINNLIRNFGGDDNAKGQALMLMGWMNSCAYSNTIFRLNVGFPLLFIWASHGQGKGTICNWLISIYNTASSRISIQNIRSGVGLSRNASYHASLPMWIDEVRADKDTDDLQSAFRDYYDRGGRIMGAKNPNETRTSAVRSCFMFAGEDNFTDSALKERCITVRINKQNRETYHSFRWLEDNKFLFSAIGFKWIKESVVEDHENVRKEIMALDRELKDEAKCSSRKSKLWAAAGVFSMRLAAKYVPGFDMKKYLYRISTIDAAAQKSESTISQFFEVVESITSMEGFKRTITDEHMIVEGDYLHIWFAHVYRMVQNEYNGRFMFSRNAVLSSIRDEPYFVSDDKTKSLGAMPNSGSRRPVITLDLTKAPEVIRNIAKINEG